MHRAVDSANPDWHRVYAAISSGNVVKPRSTSASTVNHIPILETCESGERHDARYRK